MNRVLIIIVVLVAIASAGVIGFLIGGVAGQSRLFQMYTDIKLEKIRPVLQKQEFAGVTATNTSDARVYLVGTVDSEEIYKDLEQQMRSLFGDEEARMMMEVGGLSISKK